MKPMEVRSKYYLAALAKARSGPPDAGYDRPDRAAWREWIFGLARKLDQIDALGLEDRRGARIFLRAYRVCLPLADPEWWRGRSPVRLNARERRTLRALRKHRKRASRSRWAKEGPGELEMRICEAIEVYARMGFAEGVRRCQELVDVLAGVRGFG